MSPTLTVPIRSHPFTLTVNDGRGNTATDQVVILVQDTTAPSIAISSPNGGPYAWNQQVLAAYSCADAVSGIASCVGTVANGAAIDTSTVGTHTFTVTSSDTAGNANRLDVTYSVQKITPVITWANPGSITYGAPLDGAQLNAVSSVAGTYVYTPSVGTHLPVGANQVLTAQFTPTDTAHYTGASAAVQITVNRAPLQVTADDQQKVAGTPNPSLTYTPSGFVLGEAAAVLTGGPSLSTTATDSSPEGTYPITISQGTLAAANYAFSFVNGTLTVTPVPIFLCDPSLVLPIGTINTFAGSGAAGINGGGFGGDQGPAPSALLKFPSGVAVGNGALFIADTNNHRVRRVNLTSCVIDTVAGGGTAGFAGDNGQATSAMLNGPRGVAVDSGILFIADTNNHRIRSVDLSTGLITTVAGSGDFTFGGDGGLATSAGINGPFKVAVATGGLFIADRGNNRIRRVDLSTGIIDTVAGNGVAAFSGDGGLATAASLYLPDDMVVGNGTLFIADRQNARVRRVDLTTGVITTIAGNGSLGLNGDGGPATSANVGPASLVLQGNVLFIADDASNRITRVDLTTSTITTVAGTGTSGFSGDGASATTAELQSPGGLALGNGALFIADTFNERVRRVQLQYAQQMLTVTGAPASAVYAITFTVGASGGSGAGVVTFSTSGA
jgi:hypothetical protein